MRTHTPPDDARHQRVWGGLAAAAAAPGAVASAAAAPAGDALARPEATWLQLWLPVLRALCLLCFDERAAVRDAVRVRARVRVRVRIRVRVRVRVSPNPNPNP